MKKTAHIVFLGFVFIVLGVFVPFFSPVFGAITSVIEVGGDARIFVDIPFQVICGYKNGSLQGADESGATYLDYADSIWPGSPPLENGTYNAHSFSTYAGCSTTTGGADPPGSVRDSVYYFEWDNGLVDSGSLDTKIISVDPYDGETVATSTALSFTVTGYVAEQDFADGDYIRMHVVHDENRLCQGTGIAFLQACGRSQNPFTLTFENPVDGYFTFTATSSVLYAGNYSVTTEIIHPRWYWFDQIIVATSTYFVAVAPTVYDNVANFHGNSTSSPFNPGYATTTQAVGAVCSPLTFQFNIGDCILGLFYPSPAHVSGWAVSMRDLIFTKFPLGYVYDFVSIISTTTVGSLQVIDATLPAGVVGAGSHIRLDLTNSLDFILNATTSSFNNVSASSTDTFFDITNYYWEIVVYVLLGFYILRRILGSDVIPHFYDKMKEK